MFDWVLYKPLKTYLEAFHWCEIILLLLHRWRTVWDLDIECCPKAKNENTSRNEWHGFNKGISRSFLPLHTWKPVYSMLKSFSFSLITGKYMSQLISRYIALHVQKFSKDQQVLFFARHWKTVWKKHANKKERQHKFTWRSYLRHFGNDM